MKESVELSDYAELRDNYNTEVPKVINRAIFITTNPAECSGTSPPDTCPLEAVDDFSKQFKKYASNKDPNFGFVSIFRDPYSGDIIVKNLLAKDDQGNARYIKIKSKNYKGEIKLTPLLSENDKVRGTITIEGVGSIPVSAPITSLGEEFTKTQLQNINQLDICIEEGTSCPTIDVNDINSFPSTISTSSNPDAVQVDVCPGGVDC